MAQNLSVVIITYNEERNLPRCLKSVEWADEIFVVDSYSEDNTVDAARSFGARVIQNIFTGYIHQKEFAVKQAKYDWVFIVDADEEVSKELAEEIQNILRSDNPTIMGYDIPRHVYFLHRWINHSGWYPDYQFRLFRRDTAHAELHEPHGSFVPHGDRGILLGEIYHYTYPTLFDFINTINTFTSLHVKAKFSEKKIEEVRWSHLILHPISYFLRMFIVHKGYKDGFPGLILALFSAFYTLALYAKMWEYQSCLRKGIQSPPITIQDLRKKKSESSQLPLGD